MEIREGGDTNVRLPFSFAEFLSGAYYAIAITAVCVGLIGWAVRQESRINALEYENKLQNQRLEDFDSRGTRALSERFGIQVEHLNNVDRRSSEVEAELGRRIDNTATRFNGADASLKKLDVIEARQADVLRRLELLERDLRDLRGRANTHDR